MTDIERNRVSMSLITAGSIIISAIGLGFMISNKLNTINESVTSVRTEMHAAIDSVKNKQTFRSYQTDLKFQKIEDKLDMLARK